MEVLDGHRDAESAYIIEDYPYGYRLRCQMRVWLESSPKHGQRIVRQTSNPKRPGTWNKPKASTYSPILLMVRDDEGHVTTIAPNIHDGDSLKEFEAAYLEHLDSAQRNTIAYLLAARRAMKRVVYDVHTHVPGSGCCDDKPYDQRQKEERQLIGALVRSELRKESNAALAGEEFDR